MAEKQIMKQAQTEPKQIKITRKQRKSTAGKQKLGLLIDDNLYIEFKIRALELKLNTSICLEDAMREYLDRHKAQGDSTNGQR